MNTEHLWQIKESFHENKMSHAFLVETNSQEDCFLKLKEIIKEINCEESFQSNCSNCNLCHLIDLENIPSLLVIRPDGMMIRKDQILELKQKFSTKPVYSKYNIYIILESERLNSSSANTLLKFLEEPEEGILGFFLTNNKENVIDTIKSRCQIITDFYENKSISNDQLNAIAIDYLKEVHIVKNRALLYNKNNLLNGSMQKEDYQQLFQSIIDIYYDLYLVSIGTKLLDTHYQSLEFLLKRKADYFLKQIKMIEKLEMQLGSNVNLNLLLDRFVLETR